MSALQAGFGSSYSEPFGNSGRQKTNLYLHSCSILCVGQIIGGFLIALLSYVFLFGYMTTTGLVVGAVLVGAGAVGILGNFNKNRDWINFHVVGAILGIVLCSQFVGGVWREVSVDCALAELFLKTNALDDLTKSLAQHDMFSSVHDRLNELEEMLEIVHYGMEQTVQYLKENPSGDPANQERDFIRQKLEVIRLHAMKIIDEIKNSPETTDEEVLKWKANDRARLQAKLTTAQNIVERIAKHDENEVDHAFTAKEYERMLKALMHVLKLPTVPGREQELENADLLALSDQLDVTKTVIDSIAKGVHVLDVLKEDTDSLTDESRKRRDEYTSQFRNLLQVSRSKGKKDLTAHALHFMPEHCVKESKAITYLGFLGLAVACLQVATIYMSLCVSFRIPVKMD